MKAKVILNPYANRWHALHRKAELERALQDCDLQFDLVTTEQPGHGTELARQATLEGFNPIISAGGDGSISEVVNGIVSACDQNEHNQMPTLGIMPLGSANDLAVNLRLPKDLNDCAAVIANGKARFMDLGKVNGRYFDNNSAVGLEPTITLIQQGIPFLRGALRYLLATLIGVMRNVHWDMQLEWDDGDFRGPLSLVTVGNHAITGGVFYMTPHADAFDSKLTFVYGYMKTRRQILQLLPRIMKSGQNNYVEHPDIHEHHTTRLKIRSERPTPMHADGEIQSKAISEIEYQIVPGKLPVLLNEATK
jgi:diacylglycerol kinase (ATP)